MPQRTNKYQKLILYIARQFASKEAIVHESKMLWDSQFEQKREVDIVIQGESGGFAVLIGIECTAQKRKLDATKIEQLHQKLKNTGIHKPVIVSESGFVSNAHVYAKKHGLELLTFESACKKQWPEWLAHVRTSSAIYSSFKCLGANLEIDNPNLYTFEPTQVMYLQSSELGKLETHDFIHAYYKANHLTLTDGKNNIKKAKWKFSPPLEVTNSFGLKALCPFIELTYSCLASDLELEYNEFGGKPIIHGIAETEGDIKYVGVTMKPSEESSNNEKPQFSVTIHADTKSKT